MEVHKFFDKYANTPIGDRFKLIDVSETPITLSLINARMQDLEDEMRPKRIEQTELIKLAEKFWDNKSK